MRLQSLSFMRATTIHNPTWLKKETPHLLEIQNMYTVRLWGCYGVIEGNVERKYHSRFWELVFGQLFSGVIESLYIASLLVHGRIGLPARVLFSGQVRHVF